MSRALVRSAVRLGGLGLAVLLAVGPQAAVGAAAVGSSSLGSAATTGVIRTAAANAAGIDITLPAGREIHGTVNGSDGTAIGNVLVLACGTAFTIGCGFAMSKSDGTFAIVGLAPAVYTLGVQHPNDSPFRGGYYGPHGFSEDQAHATAVSVMTANVVGIAIILPKGSVSITGKVTGAGPDSGGLADARVSACQPPYGISCTATRTRSDGTFTILGLTPGTYILSVGGAIGGPYPLSAWYQGAGKPVVASVLKATSVMLPASGLTGLAISLPALPSIKGSLVGSDGGPVAGATVIGCPLGSCAIGTSAADGTFEMRGAWPGSYQLSFTRPEGTAFASGRYGLKGFSPSWGPARPVAVAGTTVSIPTITVPTEAFSIAGTVTGAGLGPLGKVSVTACSMPSSTYFAVACETASSGPDGVYRVPLLIPGTYTLSFGPPAGTNLRTGYYSKAAGWTADSKAATGITVGTFVAPKLLSSTPKANQVNVGRSSALILRFNVDILNADSSSIVISDAFTGKAIATKVTYDARTHTATVKPVAKLAPSHPYVVELSSSLPGHSPLLATNWLLVGGTRFTFVTGLT